MPRELSEIFEMDPLGLTRDAEEVETVVRGFRDMRSKFNLGDIRAGQVKPSKVLKGVDVAGLDLDLKI